MKIDTLIKRCCAIGLLSFTEQTAKAVTSVLVVANGQACDLQACFEYLKYMKDAFKKARSVRPNKKASMQRFPADVGEFLAARPDLYTDGSPVACPIDETSITQLREAMPARSTHSSMRASSLAMIGTGASKQPSSMEGMMQLLMPLAQAFLQQSNSRESLRNGTPTRGALPALPAPTPTGLPALPTPTSLPALPAPTPAGGDEDMAAEAASEQGGEATGGPDGDGDNKSKSMGDVVAAVQSALGKNRSLAAKGSGKGKSKGKAKAKAGSKAKAKAKAKAGAGGAGPGCTKCRWSHRGCQQCR